MILGLIFKYYFSYIVKINYKYLHVYRSFKMRRIVKLKYSMMFIKFYYVYKNINFYLRSQIVSQNF